MALLDLLFGGGGGGGDGGAGALLAFQRQRQKELILESKEAREEARTVSSFRRRQLSERTGFSGLVGVGEAVRPTQQRLAAQVVARAKGGGGPGGAGDGSRRAVGGPVIFDGIRAGDAAPPESPGISELEAFNEAVAQRRQERTQSRRIITGEEFDVRDRIGEIRKDFDKGRGVSLADARKLQKRLEDIQTEKGGRHAEREDISKLMTKVKERADKAIRARERTERLEERRLQREREQSLR